MSKPQNPGWYWYNNSGEEKDWEIVLLELEFSMLGHGYIVCRRFRGPTQYGTPLSCLPGKWGKQIKRDER